VAMDIASALQNEFEHLNEGQRAIVSHQEGPLLVLAGPGSGKTHSLTLLAMNLVLCEKAFPEQLVLCTYTEKAARELQDRMLLLADQANYQGDISQMRIGTIHSICRRILNEYLHYTPFGNDYDVLDHFTQRLFIFRRLDQLCSPEALRLFQQSWDTSWNIAGKLQFYFNTITEELIFDVLKTRYSDLRRSSVHRDHIIGATTEAYQCYRRHLVETNSLDFAYILKCVYNLLEKPETCQRITATLRYVLVDEYQDTNYIQEKILTRLACGHEPCNLVAIGDEDQAIYRFRGATVRNILTFKEQFPGCAQVHLTINYRSHSGIIEAYNHWIQGFDWSNPDPCGQPLRTDKTIYASPLQCSDQYQAVATLTARDLQDEAEQCAELVAMLKEQGKIADYSEVALLLHSVRYDGEVYRQALERRAIPVSCPRGRHFFQQTEILLIIGALARILGYHPGEHAPGRDEKFARTLDLCLQMVWEQCSRIRALEEEFQSIDEQLRCAGEANTCNLADYFYRLIFLPPFTDFLQQESQQANLVLFSGLLRMFQKQFDDPTVTLLERASVKAEFLDHFLAFLHIEGLNEAEDQHQPSVQGHVQMLTIYQAKGLEFPVVVVGRLDNPPRRISRERKDLQPYCQHAQYEPESRIAGCDLRRLYYVAFSRPRRLLIVSALGQAHSQFQPLWRTLPPLTSLRDSLPTLPILSTGRACSHPRPRYGFTSHYQTYRLCPRRYLFFSAWRFVPSRTRHAFFGQLVHQTIERLHYVALEKRLEQFDEARLRDMFQKIVTILQRTHRCQFSEAEQEQAYTHVLNYYRHNQHRLSHIRQAEYAVQIEHTDYVINGKVDALIEDATGLEILDFKTDARCSTDSPRFRLYQQQLYFYACALSHKKHHAAPPRLALYWTAEERCANSLMEIPYDPDDLQHLEETLHATILQIQQQQFSVLEPPAHVVCKSCDIRALCRRECLIT